MRKPDIETKERTIIQIFEGVGHMHKNRILHRDLKPDNIFWVTDSPSVVKIGDYGLATSLADHLALLVPCGTAAYNAPEVSQGCLQTTAVDVFSLGAVTFAILEYEVVRQGWYQKNGYLFNRVFENVAKYPPTLYAGLIQSMMAPSPGSRPSLDLCVEVVKMKDYNWTKGAQLAPVLKAAPTVAVQRNTQRPTSAVKQQETALDRARAFLIKRNIDPITQRRPTETRPNLQQLLVDPKSKRQQGFIIPQRPQTPPVHATVVQAPKPSAPARAEGVNFQDGLPSYEEATGQNPFAKLVDSHELTRKRYRSKYKPPQSIAAPIVEEGAEPAPQPPKKQNKKHVVVNDILPTTTTAQSAVRLHVRAGNSRRSASHSHSTSLTRDRAQHPRRRQREITAAALDIHRVGAGRIQKPSLAADFKAGAVDMGLGLWQFGRGLGKTTMNMGALTVRGGMLLWELVGKRGAAPRGDEMRVVTGMRAGSMRREGARRRETARGGERGAR